MNLEVRCWCCDGCILSRRTQQSRRLNDLYKTKQETLSPFSSPSKSSPHLNSPLVGDTPPTTAVVPIPHPSTFSTVIHEDCINSKSTDDMCNYCQKQMRRYGGDSTEEPPILAGVPPGLQPWINPVSSLLTIFCCVKKKKPYQNT